MTLDTLTMTAEEANDLLARGEVSSQELFDAYRAAIDQRDGELHCFLRLCEGEGEGIPIALKDVIGTRGVETTAGSKILAGYVPVYDSTVAARCKGRGLRLLGKTNTDEFAMGSSTENSAFGPSRNPWDPTRVPGGSGGGSAAAVAAGMAPWALGSDTGGSIKQPAALCGNVGLRPTYGTVSRYGVVAFASSLDQVGPVAKTVRDCAFLYSVIAGRDPADSTTVDLPSVEIPQAEDLKGLRVGVPVEMRDADGIEPGVGEAVARAVALCEELGAEVEECSLPRSVEYGLPCYYLIAPAEASSNLARYDGVRYGYRAEGDDLTTVYERTRDEGFGDEPKRRIMLGTYALSAGYYDAYYGKAQQVRTVIIREHAAVFERFDLIVSATSPTVAFAIGQRSADPLAMYACDLLTIPSCVAGLPGLSIPCGLSGDLPVGLQLIGPQLSENTLFRAGHALERALEFDFVPGKAQMTDWEAVVGLEIHVHLKTRTKMFCRCETGFGAEPNTHTCPVCLAHPGALPVANRTAVEWTIKLGLALGSEIADQAVFARKNYFYPDNPKGYQISQYDLPLCVGGRLVVPGEPEFEVGFVRAHLEEDAAKTVHLGGGTGRKVGAERSLIDFNRGGTPLVEIVTQPDIRSAEQAERFLQLLRQTIVAIAISDARMEEGTLRCDANVSVRPAGSDELRTRWELKNMNSFRFIGRGIDAAAREQVKAYEAGGHVEQHTYDYEPDTDTLTPHRAKEEADDYRYFPEPDLVPLEPEPELVERLRGELPELPAELISLHAQALGTEDAWALVTTDREPAYAGLVAGGVGKREAFAFAMNQPIPAGANLPELAKVVHMGGLTRASIQAASAASADSGFKADDYLHDVAITDTSELEPVVDAVLAANPGQVEAYRGGKEGLLGFFVGQVMKETGGKANPKVVNDLLREKLGAS